MEIPQSVKNCLWSYDLNELDLNLHKKLIVLNILNYGNTEAVIWLSSKYPMDEIKDIFKDTYQSMWLKKSLNFWQIIFDTPIILKNRAEKIFANN
jgi:hypothetical protein